MQDTLAQLLQVSLNTVLLTAGVKLQSCPVGLRSMPHIKALCLVSSPRHCRQPCWQHLPADYRGPSGGLEEEVPRSLRGCCASGSCTPAAQEGEQESSPAQTRALHVQEGQRQQRGARATCPGAGSQPGQETQLGRG